MSWMASLSSTAASYLQAPRQPQALILSWHTSAQSGIVLDFQTLPVLEVGFHSMQSPAVVLVRSDSKTLIALDCYVAADSAGNDWHMLLGACMLGTHFCQTAHTNPI